MRIIAPNYYKKFSCIADKCQHSCCVGWEIDIDADTYEMYHLVEGEIGERLWNCISCDGEPHFILDENGRCPFLNSKGLCDIITECGEDALCDICADHPRFRNYRSDGIDIGLGLCCEAAASLILGFEEPFCLEIIEDDGHEIECSADEIALNKAFASAIAVAQDRTLSFGDRCEKLSGTFGAKLPDYSPLEWAKFYSSLERLDSAWDECLEYLGKCDKLAVDYKDERAAENLLCYFLYRHMASVLEDNDISSKVGFAVLSCRVVLTLAESFGIEEAARMYSSEIEYSDENLAKILSKVDIEYYI